MTAIKKNKKNPPLTASIVEMMECAIFLGLVWCMMLNVHTDVRLTDLMKGSGADLL